MNSWFIYPNRKLLINLDYVFVLAVYVPESFLYKARLFIYFN